MSRGRVYKGVVVDPTNKELDGKQVVRPQDRFFWAVAHDVVPMRGDRHFSGTDAVTTNQIQYGHFTLSGSAQIWLPTSVDLAISFEHLVQTYVKAKQDDPIMEHDAITDIVPGLLPKRS